MSELDNQNKIHNHDLLNEVNVITDLLKEIVERAAGCETQLLTIKHGACFFGDLMVRSKKAYMESRGASVVVTTTPTNRSVVEYVLLPFPDLQQVFTDWIKKTGRYFSPVRMMKGCR